MSSTIWTNAFLTQDARELLKDVTKSHRLLISEEPDDVLSVGKPDEQLTEAEILFGQPDPGLIIASINAKWIHVSSAGYARYDNESFKNWLKTRSAIFTNSSSVFDEPCAQHLMGWILADSRLFYPAYDNQKEAKAWPQNKLREQMRLLTNQTILILGYGSIGRRLTELLAPYSVRIIGFKRTPAHVSGVEIVGLADLPNALARTDHVVNILPESKSTQNFVSSNLFKQLKPGARYYSIGRGTTTDQRALENYLGNGHLAAAYLDVTDPEPLPPNDPLWSVPHCYITPHSGGGHDDESSRLVQHFLANLRRFEKGEPLLNRVF
ncbi:MAG: D-2-hydroxyacid dehydrogenase [Verrucomicrobia bacterium]|nr:D-2-hydroxyacid dehydrogenase [Verrucomicrobiota bacterium]